ncbi:hypothetical protein TRFO_25814 [Tritrichomonas foetus]|uniref:Myb-like DNA-binding domain containing protein n=1 Tax=Tritrichomonas foetus TaxID=1144522 RepID=A0A1J4K9S2_9EUKA|nr:hypothetical protein TRFO_25814 [Tritrichomonas foetus]|eukprot:OHT06197.1 hypothetical protein TRFO_25814 [Tritrichomonas foetus]
MRIKFNIVIISPHFIKLAFFANLPYKMSQVEEKKNSRLAGPSSKKVKFTKIEDEKLENLIREFGENNWKLIAERMAPRTARQCRERWTNYVNPSLSKDPWSHEEDELLLLKHEELGNHWKLIEKFFPSRSKNNIKHRYSQIKGAVPNKNSNISPNINSNLNPTPNLNGIDLTSNNSNVTNNINLSTIASLSTINVSNNVNLNLSPLTMSSPISIGSSPTSSSTSSSSSGVSLNHNPTNCGFNNYSSQNHSNHINNIMNYNNNSGCLQIFDDVCPLNFLGERDSLLLFEGVLDAHEMEFPVQIHDLWTLPVDNVF